MEPSDHPDCVRQTHVMAQLPRLGSRGSVSRDVDLPLPLPQEGVPNAWQLPSCREVSGLGYHGTTVQVADFPGHHRALKVERLSWPRMLVRSNKTASALPLPPAREYRVRLQHVSAATLAQRYFADRIGGLRPPNNSEELLVATT